MEKFSRWRDQGTGIQPFLPPVPANADHSPIEKLATFTLMIVKPITGIVKLILVGIVALALVLLQAIGLILSPLAPLHRLYHRLVSFLFIRIILGLLGFFWIKHEVVTLRRGRSASAIKSQSSPQNKRPVSGDLIISNWSSYIDVLYLAFRYDPVFTQIYSDTLTVRQISLWEAILLSGSYPESSPPAGVESLPLMEFIEVMHKKGHGPIVLFPEGTTTNNRAILKFVPIFKEFSVPETSVNVTIITLKYEYHKFAPTFTVGINNSSRLGHLFRTCAQFYNTLSVKRLAPEDSPSHPSFSPMDGLSNSPSSAVIGAAEPVGEDAFGGVVINLMGRVSRFRKLGLSVQDKADFLDFFLLRNNGIRATKKPVPQKTTSASNTGRSKRQ